MSQSNPRYVSYLLRLWQADGNGKLVWRASLESTRTGKVWGFATLDDLNRFLAQETRQTARIEKEAHLNKSISDNNHVLDNEDH